MRDGNPGVPSLIDWIVSEANQTDIGKISYSILFD